MNYKDLKAYFDTFINSDYSYDNVMNIWHDIAAELYFRNDNLPYSWEYYPGTSDPRDIDSSHYETVSSVDSNSLLRYGKVMEKYAKLLKRNGKE